MATRKTTTKTTASVPPVILKTSGDRSKVLMLNADEILCENNARFGTLPAAVREVADSILAVGEIMSPIEVTIAPDDSGFKHAANTGFTRIAAAKLIKAETGVDVQIPAIVVEPVPAKDRLLRQVAENNARQGYSPMDRAFVMNKMREEGFSIQDVCAAFPVIGGAKGNQPGPCSQSYFFKTMALLKYPADMQKKIHDGRINQAAAFAFANYDRTDWPAMLAKIEADRVKAFEKETAEDVKRQEQEAKDAKKTEVETLVKTELEKATAEYDAAAKSAKELADAQIEALKATKDRAKLATPEAKKAASDALNAAQAAAKVAEMDADKKEKALAVAKAKADKLAARIEAARTALAAKRAGAATTSTDVAAAATATGAKTKKAPVVEDGTQLKLSPAELRSLAWDISRPSGMPKCDKIKDAIWKVFRGEINVNEFSQIVMVQTGEAAAKPRGAK